MLVSITRSGGFGGTAMTATVDTDSLDPDRAKAVKAIVARTTLSADQGPMVPDTFQYDVTITDDEGSRSMRFYGDPCPASELYAAIKEL